MKMTVGALAAFLLGSVLVSTAAEAGCWWNGYNHCRYYHHGWYYHGGITAIGTDEGGGDRL
jgi:hypothetical protein